MASDDDDNDHGFSTAAEYDAFKDEVADAERLLLGFATTAEYDDCIRQGFATKAEYDECLLLGFSTKTNFEECKLLGFATKAEYDECKLLGCATRTDFYELKWRGAERRVEVLEAEVAELRGQLQLSEPFAPIDAPEGPLPVDLPSPPVAASRRHSENMLGALLPFSPRRLFQFASSKQRASWSLSAAPTGIDRATFIELVQQLIATENKEASLQGMQQQQEASAEYIGSLFDAADTEGKGTITEGGFLALYAEVKAEDADHIAL